MTARFMAAQAVRPDSRSQRALFAAGCVTNDELRGTGIRTWRQTDPKDAARLLVREPALREALMSLAHTEPGADVTGGVRDTVTLADGRTLAIRTVTTADVDGLDALFEGLSDEDRYRRFFGFSHPRRGFLEQMTRATEEGGYRLVAVVSGAGDKVVAEAGYYMLPDGNGEFALTVAAGWRGWLGPYLLDALVAVAAARGIPNLQADILTENTQMLALVSSRGFVTLGRDIGQVRVAIDAAQRCQGRRSVLPPP